MLKSAGPTDESLAGTISELNLYPVKSMKGIAVKSWPLAANGLAFDRRWMVVDRGGTQVTQRDAPRLCLITPSLLTAGRNDYGVGANDPAATQLVLHAPGVRNVVMAVEAPGAPRAVRVWDDTAAAIAGSPEVDAWLSGFLERDVQLVRFEAVEATAGRLRQRLAFPDSLPFLLIGQGSLDDVNSRLSAKGEGPVEMSRFRPNFVVAGSAPFAEDGWRQITIGELRFSVERPCARCMITTIDQATANVGREPLKTLASYRTAYRGTVPGNGSARGSGGSRALRGVIFGQKLIHHDLGTVAVGDRVTVLATTPESAKMQFVPEITAG